MTHRILKSALQGVSENDFALVVTTHAQNLKAHEAQMAKVQAKVEGYHPYPAPHVLPIVDAAVRRPDMVADYEIIDDLPDPLRVAKDGLLNKIGAAENDAINAFMAPGKQRMMQADPKTYASEIERATAISEHAMKLMAQVEDLTIEQIEIFTFSFEAKP